MSVLSFRLLGTPEIRHDGKLIRFPTRKAQALLIYLAVEVGLHSRDKLTTLLFPESDMDLGRAAFRNTLARLRAALGGDADDHLVMDGALLGLRRDSAVDIDLQRMETLSDTDNVRATSQATALSPLDLVSGSFLEGFSLDDSIEFDEWMTLQRQKWEYIIDLALDHLSTFQLNQEQYAAAIETCLCWLTRNPTNETPYRRLMILYATRGEQATALHTYEKCRQMLWDQIGLEPSEELCTLYEQIRDGTFTPPDAHWRERLTAALNLVTDDALFINPTGRFAGMERVRDNLETVMRTGIRFEIADFRVEGARVVYYSRVTQDGSILDELNDGLTILRDGKIVFDGTLRSVPAEIMADESMNQYVGDPLSIVQTFYTLLNGD